MSHSQMLGKVEYGLPGLGYNDSNELLGRSVASKLGPQQAGKKNSRAAMEFCEKRKFFSFRPPAQKRREISGWVQWVR